MTMAVGDIYRLRFPGIAARVVEPPEGCAHELYPYLMEGVFFRSRWYVNEHGESPVLDPPIVLVNRKIDKKQIVETTLLLLVTVIGTLIALWVDGYVNSLRH